VFGFFVQDDIRLRQNLTVNLGLRYELVTVPTEVNGKISNPVRLRFAMRQQPDRGQALADFPCLTTWFH